MRSCIARRVIAKIFIRQLLNVGKSERLIRIDFSKGVKFVFPEYEAGSRSVSNLCRDRKAFVERYGEVTVAGEFGSPYHNGERLDSRMRAGR
jgi:hypothetical protein